MFGRRASGDALNVVEAMGRSQAIIEFDLKGRILTANENFCKALWYSLNEIVGKHHSMFCEPDTVAGAEYREFWKRLEDGAFDAGTYKRIAKGGREIWIQASYNAICRGGKPYKVVKFAADITAAKERAVEDAGKLDAISRSQAVIEFTPSGDILTANPNFCQTLGYELSEILGKHHRMFCRKDYVATAEYAAFWQRLAKGEFIASEFVRVSKSGKEIWIQAAYNPILDASGKVAKVVKFATDVTERMSAIMAINVGMKAMSDGDLTTSLDTPFVPSMEELRANFNATVRQLRQTLDQIGENATAIANGSREISENADSFSKRSEQQAASLEQTAAALEQITTTVRDSSERAQAAGNLVARTKEGAEASGSVVRNAVIAMDKAARAGDAGKGFAVVAQEVRELAQRSAKAAKEIKALISSSSQLVKNGVHLVGQTGQSLQLIVEQVADINSNVVAIAEAAREQSLGLKEVNVAVNSMDQATQQNAAMAEESTAASADLASQARSLQQSLAHFKTGIEVARPGRSTHASLTPPVARPRICTGSSALAIANDWEEF
jgi:methyl-accepting chemotaxis protein